MPKKSKKQATPKKSHAKKSSIHVGTKKKSEGVVHIGQPSAKRAPTPRAKKDEGNEQAGA